MSLLEALDVDLTPRRKVPACCYQCDHWSTEISDWDGTASNYCELNVMLPTVKQTCKRQVPRTWISHREVGR